MKTAVTLLLLLVINFCFCQNEFEMKSSLEKLSKEYLTEMYSAKNYDNASKLLSNETLAEIFTYYKENGIGDFSGTDLTDKIKVDVENYLKELTDFKIIRVSDIKIVIENNQPIGEVFLKYRQTFKSKINKITTMLILVTTNRGKTWQVIDWKILDIIKKTDPKNHP